MLTGCTVLTAEC